MQIYSLKHIKRQANSEIVSIDTLEFRTAVSTLLGHRLGLRPLAGIANVRRAR